MRRFNACLTAAIMILFLLHTVLGSFQLIGAGNLPSKALSHTLLTLMLVHMVIGIILTAKTIKTQRLAGAAYFKENRLFWARRISGFAIMLFMIFHVSAFGTEVDGTYRLKSFTAFKLVTQILLVLSVAVHVISNVKPALISFGIKGLKKRSYDILFVLSLFLVIAAIAFVIYYIRWRI